MLHYKIATVTFESLLKNLLINDIKNILSYSKLDQKQLLHQQKRNHQYIPSSVSHIWLCVTKSNKYLNETRANTRDKSKLEKDL